MTGWKPVPLLLLLLLLLLGCTTDTAPKASHFEHDHVIAPHRPGDLADAATKIRDRLGWIDEGRMPESAEHGHDDGHDHDHGHEQEHEPDPWNEIVEIVSWIPEIAADTSLSEADWLPLYHATESLSTKLVTHNGEVTDDIRAPLESLCQMVDDAAEKIADPLSPIEEGNQ